jgi:hypothetical protein
MATKKTPGPMMQKLKARINRTKDVVGSKTKKAGELAKQEARVVTRDFTTRYEDRNVNADRQDIRQARVSARRAERTKRISDRNSTGQTIYETGDVLDRRKRVAREQIRESLSPKTFKGKTKREMKSIIDERRKIIASRPKNDAEQRARNASLQKRAIVGPSGPGAGTGKGVSASAMQNVCPVNAMSGGNKGTCKPRPSKSASPSSSKGMVTKKPMMKSTKK